jgi:hypothetical protein
MSSLDSIVSVQITRETSVPTRQGFGEGAFVSEDAVFEELIKIYTSNTYVQNDDLAGAETKKAATLYFSQEVRPPKFYVIKKGRDLEHIQVITFAGEFITGNSIDIDVDGATVTTPFNSDSDTTLTDMASNIQGEAGVGTAVANTTDNTITVTGAAVNDEVLLENLEVTGGAAQTTGVISLSQMYDEVKTYVESITRAQLVNDDWYALAIQSKDKAEQEPVADYVETVTKLFFLSTNDANAYDAGDATDIGSLLKAKSLDRTACLYSADAASDHPEMAFMGGQLPKDPGSITWAYKELSGVPVDTLTSTQKSALLGKNYNVYTKIAGLNVTEEGKVAGGEFIDIIRGTDWIAVNMQADVYTVLANADKVPFTNDGIAQVQNAMDAVLRRATVLGILAADPAYEITAPDASEVSVADKGNRLLPDMEFTGTYAGAIHKVEIQGVLSL